MVQYRSVGDLEADVRRLARRLSRDVDLIVGVPRSGILAAVLLSLHLNRSVTDVEGLVERRLLTAGRRLDDADFDWTTVERVLVVDDSVNTGREMERTRARIEEANLQFDVEYAAVYISPGGYRHVDHWVEVVSNPRVFGWNLFHHPILRHSVVDLDHLLHREADELGRLTVTDGSGDAHEPALVPTKRVGWLVSSRPEREREAIVAWLAAHGIAFDELVLVGRPDGRPAAEDWYAARKAAAYESTDAKLFVEGTARQAAEIARRTNRPVYACETDELVTGSAAGRVRRRLVDRWSLRFARFGRDPVGFARQASRHVARTVVDRANLVARRLFGR